MGSSLSSGSVHLAKLPFASVLPPARFAQPPPKRFVGIDLHKAYATICVVDHNEAILLSVNRLDILQLQSWARKHLTQADAVIFEMTTNAWGVYDFLAPLVHSALIVHPPGMTGLMPKDAKTDRADAQALACALATGSAFKHAVWVPPAHVRDLRVLLASRFKIVRMATKAKNRLQSVLYRHQIAPPTLKKNPYHPDHEPFWLSLPGLSAAERVDVSMNWASIRFCAAQQKAVDTLINQEAAKDPAAVHLIQVPGVAATLAMTIIAAIGDIARFPSAKKLVGYAGLGGRVRQTGHKLWQGGLPRSGRKELRWAMMQAASHAVRSDDRWQRAYEALVPRIGKQKAKAAIARRLLVTIWYLLTKTETDRAANAKQISEALLGFAYDAGVENLPEKNALQFVRNRLDELGIGAELTQVANGSKTFKLPPSTRANALGGEENGVIEPKTESYRVGCASLPRRINGRSRAARLLNGRSRPDTLEPSADDEVASSHVKAKKPTAAKVRKSARSPSSA